ncbi:sugar porter family MFS transporter [Fulvivirga sp. M361]|uniref:sugar porter family MFS transporter n=1 Tax=Fulvivirga sp. M361 TaxID=2594266 RepID=UPI00117BBAB6|nr:sugar porter family MFS transporter [Fulvivirga sp. M361]TRX60040.1 sugar porter family MFS transporter [Fulvivirga sp. M361]
MNSNQNTKYLFLVSITAGLGGFLFGFDTAVASGTIGFLREKFALNEVMEGWIMSSALLGSVVGAAISGFLSDKYGRRLILMFSALLFLVSALASTIPEAPGFLVAARLIGGIGVGIAAMVAPLYISELAPANLRGRLVSLYQFAITLGILFSYLSNTFLLNNATNSEVTSGFLNYIFVEEVWRGMFGSETLPAILFFVLLFFVPKSPRWLTKEGQSEEASAVLTKIHGETMAKVEMEEITDTISHESGSFKQLFSKGLRVALVIGLVLPLVSQFTGITTVMYYAPTIFELAGFQSGSAFGTAALIGFVNMIFTLVAIWKIDHFGRKPILMAGFLGLSIALFLIGFQFTGSQEIDQAGTAIVASFLFYIMVFAATIGPGVWVLLSEIYPTKVRGRAMAIGTFCLFVGSTLVTQTFPMLRGWLGIGPTFWVYAAIMLPGLYFVWKVVPETKNKTLEEIEKMWIKKN